MGYQDKREATLLQLLHLIEALSLERQIADREDLEGSALARSVGTDDTYGLARLNLKRHILERPEVLDGLVRLLPRKRVESLQRSGQTILQVSGILVAEDVPLGDVIERNGR